MNRTQVTLFLFYLIPLLSLSSPNQILGEDKPAPLLSGPQTDHTLFIYEWSRNWIITVKLDANDHIEKMERFCPNMTFKRPMDIELGPDGCLYIIENGTAWSNNMDTQIIRIEYTGDK